MDVKELRKDQLFLGIDRNYWIHTKREKTNETVKIPLLSKARETAKRYKEYQINGYMFPVVSNQKTNQYLKEIVKSCKIHKHVTFITARHTFATAATLSSGVLI